MRLSQKFFHLLAVAAILGGSCSLSYAYDLPGRGPEKAVVPPPEGPADRPLPPRPFEPTIEDLKHLYPGNFTFPSDMCEQDYARCKYGINSDEYRKEMALRDAIRQKELDIEEAHHWQEPDELLLRRLKRELRDLRQELRELQSKRKLPDAGDACLIEYRMCLFDEFQEQR